MAIGAYAMAILTVDTGISFWLALPLSMLVTMAFGLIVGLPSLRLRADYFAIATIAIAEIVRARRAERPRADRGQPGPLLQRRPDRCASTTPGSTSRTRSRAARRTRLVRPGDRSCRCCSSSGRLGARRHLGLLLDQRTPWGRVLRAVREDEDAAGRWARTRSPTSSSRWSSRPRSRAIAGWFLALNLATDPPDRLRAAGHLLRLRGAGPRRARELLGGPGRLGDPLDAARGTRFVDVFSGRVGQAALRFAIVGLVLILLMAFRPQGMFGKREEMVLGD